MILILKNTHPTTSAFRILPKVLFSSKSAQIPTNALKDVITADKQPENGLVYDKKPFKMPLEAGKRYSWCLCGYSHTQPFCDGTHKNQQLKIKLKPVAFKVEESKEYWLCNCKHTANRPFCDGTHKQPIVQEATSVVKQ
ncbi:CDGSH iron-sulfur domain-containing protein 3, mitochondrial [Tribolium castaneum]|uniref:CDGSH iron-sulfur domain-containing protein 3, mitochondrial-like Protein n=1 Tax=Tribolium castaneum TaxID=7070 RepID=D2A3Y9_TRICA|nr:PREDICTED: CDGSH iron-sulfur domain-containing protein 3, mitochondrial [Tribolium castaneum]EFA04864.1 CDGSH iron-sulfur domain-containing protein 3, mitochondrial-like Protein [Tribolium castaneum]|eukprot:XP_971748.1 PREDICTED: CDGSH iron-sulfur domain-containing protein 3, mitochondrial [Tribolium castaneum]